MTSFRPRSAPADPLPLVLYTRRNCPLCDEMKAQIERAVPAAEVELSVVDVDTDAGLAEQYGWRVPVLLIAGESTFEGRMDERDFALRCERAVREWRAREDR